MSQPNFEDRLGDLGVSQLQSAIDSPLSPATARLPEHSVQLSIEHLRQELRSAFNACRQSTLALLDLTHMTPEVWDFFCRQSHPDFSPVGWHIGHIAYTEDLWILQRLAGKPPLHPEFQRLFAADGLAKSERENLPDWPTLQTYMETVRLQVFEYLAIAPIDRQERLWRFLLQHESQHCETCTLVLTLHHRKANCKEAALYTSSMSASQDSVVFPSQQATSPHTALQTASEVTSETSSMVFVPSGTFEMGYDGADALDNERPTHQAKTPEFWIDRYPVTCSDFRRFIEAGGYRNADWWSQDGWQWFQRYPVSVPLYWVDDPVWDDHPVCGVSWYEADAYARFAGKRLPTETEWEKAARWQPRTGQSLHYPWGIASPLAQHCNHHHWIGHTTPVTTYETFASPLGCADMLGNVWEWTATLFDAYEGFQPFPYQGYSQTYFDSQHYVMRGGSWATRPWALRSSFRNWYHPWMRQIFVGFRCAMDG